MSNSNIFQRPHSTSQSDLHETEQLALCLQPPAGIVLADALWDLVHSWKKVETRQPRRRGLAQAVTIPPLAEVPFLTSQSALIWIRALRFNWLQPHFLLSGAEKFLVRNLQSDSLQHYLKMLTTSSRQMFWICVLRRVCQSLRWPRRVLASVAAPRWHSSKS